MVPPARGLQSERVGPTQEIAVGRCGCDGATDWVSRGRRDGDESNVVYGAYREEVWRRWGRRGHFFERSVYDHCVSGSEDHREAEDG